MPESRHPHHSNHAPTPGPKIQRLDASVGRWRSEGHSVGEVPVPITGTDIHEWLSGGFFLKRTAWQARGHQAQSNRFRRPTAVPS
jgi:hypothetical protein